MSIITGDGLSFDLPLELVDEIISCNQDDMVFLRSSSFVSKNWRAVTLRYLFSEAVFLCKNDFVRWQLICASLPQVAQYVRNVVVDLGDPRRLTERANSMPTGLAGRTKMDIEIPGGDIARQYPGLDCSFPKDSEFDVIIPIMRNATSLDWVMPCTKYGFDLTTPNTARFLASFPNINRLSYSSHLIHPEVHAHFLSFFHNLRKCTFSLYGFPNPVYVLSGHESRINISQLEEIWIEECSQSGAMDWLFDDVLRNSHTTVHLRKLGWEFGDPPFSSDSFARIVRMARGTLEELCFRPPWTPSGLEGCTAPPFGFDVLPALQILSFRILYLTGESDRIMQWLKSIFAVFPSCPRLQRLEFTFYLAESTDIDSVSAFKFLNWKSLLEDRYPSLKVLEFEMMMEDEEAFEVAERKRVETIIRQSMAMVESEKFVMRWSPAR